MLPPVVLPKDSGSTNAHVVIEGRLKLIAAIQPYLTFTFTGWFIYRSFIESGNSLDYILHSQLYPERY